MKILFAVLLVLGIFGCLLLLFITKESGIGIYADPVTYIAATHSLLESGTYASIDGNYNTVFPPGYPILIGIVSLFFHRSLYEVSRFVQAVLFGLIMVLSGVVAYSHSRSKTISLIVPLISIASYALIGVSVAALSEPLFIVLSLLFLIGLYEYRSSRRVSLVLLLVTGSMLPMVRYMGTIFVIIGGLFIYRYSHKKQRFQNSAFFMIFSSLPILAWVIRNYIVSHTLFGYRVASQFSLVDNMAFVSRIFYGWYFPQLWSMPIILFIILLLISTKFSILRNQKTHFSHLLNPLTVFVVIYVILLVVTSSLVAYDSINNRLLSPVYIPLTILLLQGGRVLFRPVYVNLIQYMIGYVVFILALVPLTLGWVYSINHGFNIVNAFGYRYILTQYRNSIASYSQLKIHNETGIYSNNPWLLYALTNTHSKYFPSKVHYNSLQTQDTLEELSEQGWPSEEESYAIWFYYLNDGVLFFTPQELSHTVRFTTVVKSEEMEIYALQRL